MRDDSADTFKELIEEKEDQINDLEQQILVIHDLKKELKDIETDAAINEICVNVHEYRGSNDPKTASVTIITNLITPNVHRLVETHNANVRRKDGAYDVRFTVKFE